MNFKSLFSSIGSSNVHTDADYLRVLRRRRRIFIGMMVLGIITACIAACAEFLNWDISLTSRTLGFYSGVGTGMTFGAAVLLLRLRRAMKDEKSLREARINETDERTQEISRRALAAAGYALLVAVYLVCLIGGLFYPKLLIVLATLAVIYVATLSVSYFIYNKIIM